MRKEIKDFPGYAVDTDGNVWSRWINGKHILQEKYRKLNPIKNSRYLRVNLVKNKKRHMKSIHRLVLETFRGECLKGMQACHNDGNRMNNKLSNLRWDTPKNNHKDRYQHGTAFIGSNHPNAKMNEMQVRIIRKYPEANSKKVYSFLGKIFNVSYNTIKNVRLKRTWNHI